MEKTMSCPPSRVVLADDHPIVLSGLQGLLSTLPNLDIVAMVRNGAEALAAVRAFRPEMAILDINMPELTGVQVLEALDGLSTRVILLTSSASDAQVANA